MPFVLLPRFDLDTWADAVRRHRPKAVSLVPAALRAVLHSDLGPVDLTGIRAVTCGTAPLSADDAEAFTTSRMRIRAMLADWWGTPPRRQTSAP